MCSRTAAFPPRISPSLAVADAAANDEEDNNATGFLQQHAITVQ